MDTANQIDGGVNSFGLKNISAMTRAKSAIASAKSGMSSGKSGIASGMSRVKNATASGVSSAASGMSRVKNATASGVSSAASGMSRAKNAAASGMSSAAKGTVETFGLKAQHSIVYILIVNFVIRGFLYLSMYINSITTKNTKRSQNYRDALQHSMNTLGVSIASLLIGGYAQIAINTSEHTVNTYLNTLLLILLYVVILYDAMVPLFKTKKKGSKKADRDGALAGLILMPIVIAGFFILMAYEFDVTFLKKFDFKLIGGKFYELIIMFLISILFSLLSFFMIYSSEMNKNKKPGFEEKLKLMKSFFMILLITIFLIVLVLEYLKNE